MTLEPIAKRLAVELSSPAWVCRDWEWNTQPPACGANALTHFATAAVKKEEIMHFHTMINIYIFVDHCFFFKLLYDQRRKEEDFRGNIYVFFIRLVPKISPLWGWSSYSHHLHVSLHYKCFISNLSILTRYFLRRNNVYVEQTTYDERRTLT